MDTHERSDKVSEALERIRAHEATVRGTLLTRIFRWLGKTRVFGMIYRVVGPPMDRWLYKNHSDIVAKLYGLPAMLLHTTGAKSGQPRTSPLLYMRDGEDFLVVGTNFGQAHHPAWTANLLARPEGEMEIAGQRVAVTATLADDSAFDRLFALFVDRFPGYGEYLARSGGRKPRLFILRPR
jgi:deazaflavin-dependent oxidoreductase (nitroreductase family)